MLEDVFYGGQLRREDSISNNIKKLRICQIIKRIISFLPKRISSINKKNLIAYESVLLTMFVRRESQIFRRKT